MVRRRGFTIIELMTAVAITGIIAALGMVSVVDLVQTERARNDAARFAAELRRQRAEAMLQGRYTLIDVKPDGGGGTKVVFRQQRLGSVGVTPCQRMANKNEYEAEAVRQFSVLTIKAESTLAEDGAAPTAQQKICMDPLGRPVVVDDLKPMSADFTVSHEGEEKLSLTVEAIGALSSTDQPIAAGIAQTSWFPSDLMLQESAPVPPNVNEASDLPTFEIAPGEFVDVAGYDAAVGPLGGSDNPCLLDPAYCDACMGASPPAGCECILYPESYDCEYCYGCAGCGTCDPTDPAMLP